MQGLGHYLGERFQYMDGLDMMSDMMYNAFQATVVMLATAPAVMPAAVVRRKGVGEGEVENDESAGVSVSASQHLADSEKIAAAIDKAVHYLEAVSVAYGKMYCI